MLLSKASPSSHRFLTQSPLANQRQNFSNSSLPFPHPQSSSLLDHSQQPKNTPLFLLSSIIILITYKSHTVTPYFSTLLGSNTPQNRCLFLETWVLLLPWSLKSTPARFLPSLIKRALFKSWGTSTLLNPMADVRLWRGFMGHHSFGFLLLTQASLLLHKVEVPQGPHQFLLHTHSFGDLIHLMILTLVWQFQESLSPETQTHNQQLSQHLHWNV